MDLLRRSKFFSPKAILVSPSVDSQSLLATISLLKSMTATTGLRSIRMDQPNGLVFYDTLSMLWKGFHTLVQRDVAIYRYIEPLPGDILCGMDNRKPFVTHFLDTLGNSWVLFATPLGRSPSNNLCETGLYVPLLDRVMQFALESIHKDADEWIAGKPRRNPFLGSRHPAIVYNARNERHSQWGSQLQVKFEEPGVYRIQPYEGPSFWIAVNSDPHEMELVYHSPKTWKNGKNHITVVNADEFLTVLKTGKGFLLSYGPWILLAMLIAAEMFLWEKNIASGKEKTTRKT
jgi:hypothetical protein